MIVGIDIGLSGAIAILGNNELYTYPMPVVEESYGNSTRKIVCGEFIADILNRHQPGIAVIERVNAMPNQGVTSMFRFGEAKGVVYGVLGALGIGIFEVTANDWKKYHNLIKKDKSASRDKAIELFPDNRLDFSKVKDHGRAEAALIALYGDRRLP